MENIERPPIAEESEDIPSDFFDDFSKEEFIEGLSVIDSWDEEKREIKKRHTSQGSRIAEVIDSVNDLRELIGDSNEDRLTKGANISDNKYERSKNGSKSKGSSSKSYVDDFIKPGSRRDPNKTNEAIKKDKEEKVKKILSKQLESSDDLRPPGTELDDFLDDEHPRDYKFSKRIVVKKVSDEKQLRRSPNSRNQTSPVRKSPSKQHRQSPPELRWSPRRSPRWTPRYQARRNPLPFRVSPHNRRRSPPRRSPYRRSPRRHSPVRRSPVRRSPHRSRRSRSPRHKRTNDLRRSRTRSRSPYLRDSFLYPKSSAPHLANSVYPGSTSYQPDMTPHFAPIQIELPGNVASYSYSQVPVYDTGYPGQYDYSLQSIPISEPVMGAVVDQTPRPIINPVPPPVLESAPPMVPAPITATKQPNLSQSMSVVQRKAPYDALAQLVAEGKISKEDYLKLAPNKGVSSSMDINERVTVLNRCSTALNKLSKLLLPNRLVMKNNIIGPEPKYLGPKFCSPLKRQAAVEFHFTKTNGSSTAQQDKQLVDSIISALDLENVVTRNQKRPAKDMKDAAVQTMKPYCDICEIRDSINHQVVGTCTEPEYFTSTVHTQVVEQDLISSKSIFNPTGSVADAAPISIAHMTPAQLVSQLAARAKTLKQADPQPAQHQFGRRNTSYDYEGGGGGQYQNYNNYRY